MKTLAAIESFTGGLFASEIVSRCGASRYFKGALVAYAPEIKAKLGIATTPGVINKTSALALAKAGQVYFHSDICVAFTGNAGPGVQEDKAVGHVFIAINDVVYERHFTGGRNAVRQQAVAFAMANLNLGA